MKTLVTDGFDGEMPEDEGAFERGLREYMEQHKYTTEHIARVMRLAGSLTVRRD